MVKKDVAKKWLALLIVMVVLSLVVDLLSLNALYSISNERNGLEGSLATTRSECEAAANKKYLALLEPLYEERNRKNQELYALERIKDQDCDAVYEDLRNSGYCIDRASIEWEIGGLKTDISRLNQQISNGITAWLAALLKCRSGNY